MDHHGFGQASAEITLAGVLDYERQNRYELTVEARDPAGNTDTALAIINVEDRAEEGDGDPLFHGNADYDATGETPAAVSDGPLSVNQFTGDVVVASGEALGVDGEGVLPLYQSGTLGRPTTRGRRCRSPGNATRGRARPTCVQ